MKRLSLVIPVLNEERNIQPIYQALAHEFAHLPQYAWEVLFVDDGSQDGSLKEIQGLSNEYANVQYLELARNFGKESATTAGIRAAAGDAIILLDADLQHPPNRIKDFLQAWETGADIVVGIRLQNKGEGWVKRVGSRLYYHLMSVVSDTTLQQGETDFRLIDRSVIEAFNQFTEHNRMTRALLNWLGFKRVNIYFTANARMSGKAAYSPAKLLRLAISSFIAHSLFPLKFAGYLGTFTVFVAAIGVMFVTYVKYFTTDPWHFHFSGLALLAFINLLFVGILLMCLGLVALYVGTIHQEVANRPLYVVRSKNL